MSERRLGKFYLHSEDVLHNTDYVADMLAKMKFVPTRCEFIAHRNQFEYIGLAPLFEDVQVGEMLHEYALECSKDQHGNVVSVHGNRI
jgi:hypothetical protein